MNTEQEPTVKLSQSLMWFSMTYTLHILTLPRLPSQSAQEGGVSFLSKGQKVDHLVSLNLCYSSGFNASLNRVQEVKHKNAVIQQDDKQGA